MEVIENLSNIRSTLPEGVELVAVSKTKPAQLIEAAYNTGQRAFGENKVQEIVDKHDQLPDDIAWHFIGHLQRNKVKYIAPFVHLIHSVDSLRLAKEINKRAAQNDRTINCLLQVHIADEDSKFGIPPKELLPFIENEAFQGLENICIKGLMGMATFTDNTKQLKKEFGRLSELYKQLQSQSHPRLNLEYLSMGMSGDYKLAIDCGSNMIRLGSTIFGARD